MPREGKITEREAREALHLIAAHRRVESAIAALSDPTPGLFVEIPIAGQHVPVLREHLIDLLKLGQQDIAATLEVKGIDPAKEPPALVADTSSQRLGNGQ
ncbi:MAG TPA: hypothetical protein VEC14_05265 [Reyranellaceae bacterium]|nr:hypothetical protein [Reyranellaceae bacterium]